ncbi:hypothetical protein E3G52_000355 [Mycobacteroides abscessus]|uniref:hypothetical protein n=1 Tax=Mycobacteroides abscessus TaxID=36809 RepID=UPI001878E8DC|nr:hypothetical protein [Mycobacteroides abscessus]MBE5453491.1 hypothetical protein [Mycobacteroides abscessus]
MTGQRVGYVDMITGVVYVDHISGEKHSGVHAMGGLTPGVEPHRTPDPVSRALALITDMHRTVQYLTAPRWKRPFLRLLRRFW